MLKIEDAAWTLDAAAGQLSLLVSRASLVGGAGSAPHGEPRSLSSLDPIRFAIGATDRDGGDLFANDALIPADQQTALHGAPFWQTTQPHAAREIDYFEGLGAQQPVDYQTW